MRREDDPSEEDLVRAACSFPPPAGECLAPERLVDFYAGAIDEADSEDLREHLSRCFGCTAAAADARRFVEKMPGWSDRPAVLKRPVTPRRWWLAAAAGMAAVALGLFIYRIAAPAPEDPEARWRDITIAKAPYSLVNSERPDEGILWRDSASGGMAIPNGFNRGMEAYTAGDLREAARLLSGVVKEAPRHAASRFYLGVTLLLLDRADEAVPNLERAAPMGDEQAWYLALALLKTGQQERAAEILESRADWREDPHREEAGALLRRIRQRDP